MAGKEYTQQEQEDILYNRPTAKAKAEEWIAADPKNPPPDQSFVQALQASKTGQEALGRSFTKAETIVPSVATPTTTYKAPDGTLISAPDFTAFSGQSIPGAPTTVQTAGPATAAKIGTVDQLSTATPTIAAGQSTAKGQGLSANLVQGQQLTGEGADVRAQQMSLAAALQARAAGTAPSAAEMQLKQGQDRAIASQAAIAATAKGSPALAQRQAAINTANIQQAQSGEAAKLRMQEQESAQKQLADLYGATRAADITVASKNADMAQNASLANQQALNSLQVQQAQLAQDAANLNAQLQTTTNVEQQKLLQSNLQQNQSTQLQLRTKQADLEQRTAELNKAAQDAAYQLQAQLQQASSIKAAEIGSQEKQFGAAQTLTARTENAKLGEQAKQMAAQQAQELAIKNAELAQNANIANQTAKLQAQGLDDQQIARMMGIDVDKLKAIMTDATQQKEIKSKSDIAQEDRDTKKEAGILGGIATIGAAMLMSDQNQKTSIKPIDDIDEEEKKRQQKRRFAEAAKSFSASTDDEDPIKKGGDDLAAALKYRFSQDKAEKKPEASVVKPVAPEEYKESSDERLKKDIKSSPPMEEFLNSLNAYSYKYKNAKLDGAAPGQRYGVLAQEVEQTPVGASIVQTKDGKKMLDIQQGFGVTLAALSNLNKRLNDLEKK